MFKVGYVYVLIHDEHPGLNRLIVPYELENRICEDPLCLNLCESGEEVISNKTPLEKICNDVFNEEKLRDYSMFEIEITSLFRKESLRRLR